MGKKGSVKLVIPKNSGDLNIFDNVVHMIASNNGQMNTQELVRYLELTNEQLDITSLYHKTVMPRYFGLLNLKKDDKTLYLTDLGMAYYLAQTKEDKIDVIFDALSSIVFGRHNNAVDSDSDVEAPVVFLKCIKEMQYANSTEIGIVLYYLEIKHMTLLDSVEKVRRSSNIKAMKESIVSEIGTKFFDLKFNVLFENLGIVHKANNMYYLSNYVKENYMDIIDKLMEVNMFEKLSGDEGVYYPSRHDYTPNITADKWKDFIEKKLSLDSEEYKLIRVLYNNQGECDYITLAKELKKEVLSSCIGKCGQLGIVASEYFNVEPYIENGVKNFLSVPFVGKYVVENKKKLYFLKLRKELYDAVDALTKDTSKQDENPKEKNVIPKNLPKREKRKNKHLPLNQILYGAPGTGKTYATAEYALKIVEPDFKANNRDEIMKKYREHINSGRIIFTTFHQSYGYEDFIQGLRPNSNSGNLNFEPVDGIFKRIADRAMYDNKNDYVIIIDEINRANISKVLGELITLIEDNKRWGEVNALSVTLPSGEVFAVPNNLYIIGTMNSADKSISLIDTALRRRFEFVEFVPKAELVTNKLLKEIIVKLNKALKDEFENTDLLIGHAYFIDKSEDDLSDIMNNSVIPLLYEYNYDNSKKVKTQLNEVLKDTDFKISASEFGRIKIEKSDANA